MLLRTGRVRIRKDDGWMASETQVVARSVFAATVILVALLTVVPFAPAQSRRAAAEEPLEVLLHAQQVDDVAVGTAGSRSERYDAFVELWNEGRVGRSSVDTLIEKGTPAGRIYGLILLQEIDAEAAARAGAEMKASGGDVNVLSGCLMMKYPVAEIVDRIVSGGHVIVTPALPIND
jgi:hypothetical protein